MAAAGQRDFGTGSGISFTGGYFSGGTLMNIALFSAGPVGREIYHYFCEQNEPLACMSILREQEAFFNETYPLRRNAHPVIYSDTLYDPATLQKLEEMKLDLIILAWWPHIVKKSLMELPKLGCLNFHPSLLPHNRGKNPNFWSIVEERPYGVSIHFIDEGIDSGDIVFQREISKTWEDTGGSLYEKGLVEIVRMFKDNFEQILAGNLPRQCQDLTKGSFHLAKEMDQASEIKLDEVYTARHLINLLRARTFSPHPAAWFQDGDKKYEIRIEISEVES
jgi:methionyl-tRNA formyltransferase